MSDIPRKPSHSPGPWLLKQKPPTNRWIVHNNIYSIARVIDVGLYTKGNAALLGAADELLSVTKILRQYIATLTAAHPDDAVSQEIFDIVDAVIAKAEGQEP